MKTKHSFLPKLVLVLAATVLMGGAATRCQAQTNLTQVPDLLSALPINPTLSGGLQQVWDAATTPTNFAVVFGGGRSLHGQNTLMFADYAYNLSQNVGVILGYDAIRGKVDGGHVTTYNFVKGGIQLQAEVAPFRNFGLPKVKVQPFGGILISTSGGSVGQILYTGVNYRLPLGAGWDFNVGALYENRTGGLASTDGPYLGAHFAFSRNF